MSTRRVRRLLCTAMTGLLAGTLLGSAAGQPARAATVDVPAAPEPGSTVGPRVHVASATFAEGLQFVVATVSAKRASSARRMYFMFAATLTCGKESITSTTNIDASGTLTPRRIMTDASDCSVYARSALGSSSADRLEVSATFRAVPVTFGASEHTTAGFPTLLEPGDDFDAVPAVYSPAPGASYLRIAGDVKVTACTSVGGSRENGSGNLCEGRVNTSGSRVRIRLIAQQLGATGGYCAVETLADRTLHVNKFVHHVNVYHDGVYRMIRGNAACRPSVRVKIYVQALSGADLVVHRGGTIVSAYRS
jgi:hypothetical protein